MEEINRNRAGDNIRLEESEILARELYSFFQQNKSDVSPEVCTGIGNMIDQLLTGRTCQIRRRLTRVEEDGGGMPSREINALWNKIAAYEKKYKISTYSVYQLVIAEHTDQYRFVSYRGVEKRGLSVQRSNYRMVYNKELTPADTLDTIYMDLNLYHPKAFEGHSLSVSDVVVFHERGKDTAWYVDNIGFREIPGFFGKEEQTQKKENRQVRKNHQSR